MKQNEILEGNKLIAEFMGMHIKESVDLYEHWIYPESKSPFKHRNFTLDPSDLEYHLSWDWLIPAVEKIEKFDNGVCSVLITGNACDIAFSTKYNMQGEDYDAPNFIKIKGSKISSAWSTVVDFIKWHNSLNYKI